MKRKSTPKSAFFNPRCLLGFVLSLAGAVVAVIGFGMYSNSTAMGQKLNENPNMAAGPQVVPMVGPVSQDLDLRNLPYIPPLMDTEEFRLTRHPRTYSQRKPDPLQEVRCAAQVVAMPTPIATYPGITSAQSGCGCLPPSTHGDAGPNHYIQSVNKSIKITDKSGNELMAPTTYNSFFSALGAGTPCGANQNQGDGFVIYDHLADRWVVSDFAFPSFPGTSFWQCIGVSQTSDPVSGGWWLYALQVDSANPNYLGDYPKFALWPDAYYFSVNLFSNNATFNGVRVFALPRLDMINGIGAPNPGAIAFTVTPANLGDAYSLVPATFRTGSAPPVGTPEYFLAVDSPASADVTLTQVHAWRFHVDFVTPANSSFGVGAGHTANGEITVNGFVDAFTTTTLLVPQNGTASLLDTVGDKLMTPLVYQNRSGTESLYASQTVNNNQGGTGPAAIRWYQFDVTGSTIPATAAQQQTFNNGADGFWRWMPSIAVDAQGNVAIAYSTSSGTSEPSIRYAGRLATDPLNTMAQGEAVMQAGGGHQTSSSGAWGTYSALAVDPSDDVTFWHTNEYYSTTGSAGWNTRIGKFQFPAAPTATGAVSRKTHGASGDFDVDLPLTGTPGIECRSNSATNDYTMIVTFATPVTVNGSPQAEVTLGAGTVGSGGVSNGGMVTISGNTVTIPLTNVTNAQTINVTLHSVNGVSDVVIPMSVLIGDTNGNGGVNAGDVSQTKGQSGIAVGAGNFRNDVNASGATINAGDVALVKSKSGTVLPP